MLNRTGCSNFHFSDQTSNGHRKRCSLCLAFRPQNIAHVGFAHMAPPAAIDKIQNLSSVHLKNAFFKPLD